MGKRVLVLLVMLAILGSPLALASLDGDSGGEPTVGEGTPGPGGLLDEIMADTIAPAFGTDRTPANVGTGKPLKFDVTISDAGGVLNASVDYWGTGFARTSAALQLESGTNQSGNYTASITAPISVIGTLYYEFWATDIADNTNSTTGSLTQADETKPWIEDMTLINRATTGEAFSFMSNVTDNAMIIEVRIEYRIGSPPWVTDNTTMVPLSVNSKGIGTYIFNITVPDNSTEAIQYETMAWDSNGNFRIRHDQANVTDNDRPSVTKDSSDTSATTGDVVHFEVEVTDNVKVSTVRLNYKYTTDPLRNVTMNEKQVNAEGIGSYQYDLLVPEDYVGDINYTFSVRDEDQNWNSSQLARVVSVDDDPPAVGPDNSFAEGETRFEFRVNATDNVGVASVRVNYTLSGSDPVEYVMIAIDVDANGNGAYGGVGVDIPQGTQVRLDYRFTAFDAAGHTRSISGIYTSQDDEPPVLGENGTWGEPIKGGTLALWVRVSDNIGVKEVKVEYWFGGGTHGTEALADEGGGLYNGTIQLPRWPMGNLTYFFQAWDLKGNQNSTSELQMALYNLPPMLTTGWVWNVTEEETEVLDLTPYLSDGNDAVTSLSVTTEAGGVIAQGRKLTLYYDDWREDHTISINITDGEDTITAQVSIHVININDPPVYTSDPPAAGAVGEEYRYQVEFFDTDEGDTHEFAFDRAPTGMTVSSGGLVTWTPAAGQEGVNAVDLIIRDGTVEVFQTWSILVTGLPNRAPAFTNSPPTTHVAGTPYTWDAEATDPDEDTITFSLVSGPQGTTVNSATGLLTWDPVVDKRDTTEDFEFVVRVSDGPHSVDLPFTVSLTYPANQAPVIKPGLGSITVTGKKSFDLTEYMSDPDDAVRDLDWNVTYDSKKFVARMHDNFLVIEPKKNVMGKGTVTLTLKDPWGLSDSQELTVNVDTEEEAEGGLGTTTLFLIVVAVVVIAGLIYIFKDRLTERKRPGPPAEEETE